MQIGLRYDLSGPARICIWLVGLCAVGDAVLFVNDYFFLSFVNAADSGALYGAALEVEAEKIDARGVPLGYGYLGLLILTMILCSVWIYRASWNAGQLQPDAERITPGWSVGWFAVPLLSLWKPYGAIRQTWNSSHHPDGDMNMAMPGFTALWWGAWIVTNILGQISFRLWRKAVTLDDFRVGLTIDMITAPISILSAVLFIRLIKAITTAQAGKMPAMTADTIVSA